MLHVKEQVMIDQPRYAEWVKLSHRTARFEKFMTPAIQGLGKLDAVLMAKDAAYVKIPREQRESVDATLELNDRFTQSYLWVLGVYEIIRTMDQRYGENADLASEATGKAIRNAKHKFERIRVPLAKFEPARRFSDTDSAAAFPALHMLDGIGWQIAENVYVTRKELSECFIELFREL